MANGAVDTVTSAGKSAGRAVGDAGRAVGDAMGGLGDTATKTASRTREEVEDILADARSVADKTSIPAETRDKAAYAGLVATAGLGVLEWPLAIAIGAGYAAVRSTTRGRNGRRRTGGGSRPRSRSSSS